MQLSPSLLPQTGAVLYNILGLIKSNVRLRQAEQGEADCGAQAAAEQEGGFAGALTLFYMLKLMEGNKHCHHSFSPRSPVSYKHTQMYKCVHTLHPALTNVAPKCLFFFFPPPFSF